MKDNYKVSSTVLKRIVVKEAIKAVAPNCKGNFEIPMSALTYISKGNNLRKKPVRASYDYVRNMMHEMIRNNEI